jgi:hypothetical protein
MADEIVQRLSRLLGGHRPGKVGELPGVVGEMLFDQRHGFAGHCIRREAFGGGDQPRALAAEGLAIVGIEIPLAADRFAIGHQNVVPLALPAVEKLQAQAGFFTGPGVEFIQRTEKVRIGADQQRDVGLLAGGVEFFLHPPIAGFEHDHGAVFMLGQAGAQGLAEAGACGCSPRAR